ncbi:MAG: DUF3829 domain-containing protein [Kofleriaceae bacterium]|nr:DUF3829 domain-containing protein [Kofleriaceae bacterium]
MVMVVVVTVLAGAGWSGVLRRPQAVDARDAAVATAPPPRDLTPSPARQRRSVDAAPAPDAAPRLSADEVLAGYRYLVDVIDRNLRFAAAGYPAVAAASHAASPPRQVRWDTGFLGDDEIEDWVAGARDWVSRSPGPADLDAAVARYADHLAAGAPTLGRIARYVEHGAYRDDAWAEARTADELLTPWFQTLAERSAEVRAALAGPWQALVDDLQRRAEGSPRAVIDRAWRACGGLADLLEGRPSAEQVRAARIACRAGTEEARARLSRRARPWIGWLERIYMAAGERAPRSEAVVQTATYAARGYLELRTEANADAAEAAPP